MTSIGLRQWGWRALATAVLSIGLAACGGDAPEPEAAAAPEASGAAVGYTLALDPPALTVGQGREAWLSVSVTRDAGFDGAIEVTLNQPPAGVRADTLVLAAGIDSGPLPIHLAADLPEGSVLVLDVKASSGALSRSAASTLTVSLPKPYAQTAIAAALASGSIDYGTSLLYRAYALFGDARLPDAYLGAGSVREDNLLFKEIRLRLAEFPPERQAELRAFIVRPTDALSVWNRGSTASSSAQPARMKAASSGAQAAQDRQRRAALPPESCASLADGAWVSKLSSKYSDLRVWMQCGPAPINDAVVQHFIDVTLAVLEKVYVPMTDMMGKTITDFFDGGDGAIDFYIVQEGIVRRGELYPPIGAGSTHAVEHLPGKGSSSFVLLPRWTLSQPWFHTNVIHEFFHVLQNTQNPDLTDPEVCNGDACKLHWFTEASAAWAAAYFDRTLWSVGRAAFRETYHFFAETFQTSDAALNATDDGSKHDYSAFIWPYFVEQETKRTDFMKQIWNGLVGVKTVEAADDVIDAAYSFAQNFPRFAVRNLNREFTPGGPLPEMERYVSLDPAQFKDADKKEPTILTGDLVAESAYSQPLNLANLSARYVKLAVQGSNIKKVELDTGGLAPGASLVVEALVETTNGWVAKPIELSNGKIVFCFDRGPTTEAVLGSFKQMVLVLSNHALRKADKIEGELKAMPTAKPCSPFWQGTVNQTYRRSDAFGTTSIDMMARVAFEFDPTAVAQAGETSFRPRSGTYSYSARTDTTDNGGACRILVTSSGPIPPKRYEPPLAVVNATSAHIVILSGPQRYSAGGLSNVEFTQVSNCYVFPRADVTTVFAVDHFWWLESAGALAVDRNSFEGSHETTDQLGGTLHWDYRFENMP